MRKSLKKLSAVVLSAAMVATTVPAMSDGSGTAYASGESSAVELIELTDNDLEVNQITDSAVSVHDPSVVQDPTTGKYYIFGSHRAWAKSDDLVNWTMFENNINKVTNTNYKTTYSNVLPEDVVAWSAAGDSVYDITGNLWAPDVIWNDTLGKWCMYLSINGCSWNSSIIMLTADTLDGNWTYVDTIIYSGFTASGSHSYEKTDYKEVTGDASLPSRYISGLYTCIDGNTKTEATTWNNGYGAHAIDPCVFYDETGKLWMTYGSWSGGIYAIELDEATGLRDKTVTYTDSLDSDPYMGKRLAGGSTSNWISGEASYVQYINGYYYLFVTYGGLTSTGGYNMHVFRSLNPDGPYTDVSGDDAKNGTKDYMGRVGTKLFTYQKWDWWNYGQVAQGHNSAIVTPDGDAFVVYHTRTTDGGEGHYVRTHQLFTTENGYLVAAPFQYHTTDTTEFEDSAVAGTYKVIVNEATNFSAKELNLCKTIKLASDGTVTGDMTGTWQKKADSNYITLTLDGETYEGAMVVQTLEDVNSQVNWGSRKMDDVRALCFSAVGKTSDIIISGEKGYGASAIAYEKNVLKSLVPSVAYGNINLPVLGELGTNISWSSSNTSVITNTGKVTRPAKDTAVKLTAVISDGAYKYTCTFDVTVKSTCTFGTDGKALVASYFTNNTVKLPANKGLAVVNPFNKTNTKGIDVSNGVSIKFDVRRTGNISPLATILGFNSGNGRMFFTDCTYLGYNGPGGYFDANLKNYATVKDYIGTGTKTVEIMILPDGYKLYVNNTLAYSSNKISSSAVAGTLKDYSKILTWLSGTCSTVTLGEGAFWDNGNPFVGTIKNLEFYVLKKGTEMHVWNSGKVTTAATCTGAQVTTYTCTECGVTKKVNTGKALGHTGGTATCTAKAICTRCGVAYGSLKSHTYTTKKTVKATTKKNGYTIYACKDCGVQNAATKKTIYVAKTIKLSKTVFTYNKKTQVPKVTVKDSKGNKLVEGTDFVVEWEEKGKSVGIYTGEVVFKGKYKGSEEITYTIKPAATTLKSVKPGKKLIKVTWKKLTTQTQGYEIQIATDKNFKKNVKKVDVYGNKKTSATVKKLKSKKKYYVRIRTYKEDETTGENVYSSWSKAKSVTVK